jgi:hypothetical protein
VNNGKWKMGNAFEKCGMIMSLYMDFKKRAGEAPAL